MNIKNEREFSVFRLSQKVSDIKSDVDYMKILIRKSYFSHSCIQSHKNFIKNVKKLILKKNKQTSQQVNFDIRKHSNYSVNYNSNN